jgi:hypothetical protein
MEHPPNKTTGLAWHPVPAAASHCDALSGRSPPPVPTWEQKISPSALGVPILGFFGWEEFRCQSFSIFCGWETLGIEGSIFLGYVEQGKPGRGQLKVEVSGKSSHWHSNQRIRKKNVKILGFNGTIIHWNQIIREKSSTGKLSTKPVIVPISPGLRCWPGPSGNLLQPQNGRGACKRSMGKCTPWSTLSIQHSFPLFSPKAFKNFKTAYGFRRILTFDITVCVF